MPRRPVPLPLAGSALLLLAACAETSPLRSVPVSEEAQQPGLVYALPRSMIEIAAREEGAERRVTYTFTATTVPDDRHRYRLVYTRSAWTDSNVDVTVNEQGLLTTGTSRIQDQTGAVVVEVARLAGAAAGAVEELQIQRTPPHPAPARAQPLPLQPALHRAGDAPGREPAGWPPGAVPKP